MKKIIVVISGIFVLSASIVACNETANLVVASLPKQENVVKCKKLGTARQAFNSKGEPCNKW